jgi:hypothetical protein
VAQVELFFFFSFVLSFDLGFVAFVNRSLSSSGPASPRALRF